MFSSFTTDRGKQLVIIPQEQEEASKQLFWIVVWGTMPPRAICRLMQFTYHCLLKLVLKKQFIQGNNNMQERSGLKPNKLSCLLSCFQRHSAVFVGENRGSSPSN